MEVGAKVIIVLPKSAFDGAMGTIVYLSPPTCARVALDRPVKEENWAEGIHVVVEETANLRAVN